MSVQYLKVGIDIFRFHADVLDDQPDMDARLGRPNGQVPPEKSFKADVDLQELQRPRQLGRPDARPQDIECVRLDEICPLVKLGGFLF